MHKAFLTFTFGILQKYEHRRLAMKIISSLGLFLTSEWIWAVTFARPHILLSMPIMLIVLLVARTRLIPAVMYAFFSPLLALSAFTFLVHGIIDRFLGIHFQAAEQAFVVHPLTATFLLAIIYTLFQALFFYILSFFYTLPIQRYTVIALIANLITMTFVYKVMPSL